MNPLETLRAELRAAVQKALSEELPFSQVIRILCETAVEIHDADRSSHSGRFIKEDVEWYYELFIRPFEVDF